jgi:hypothetical protein
MRPSAPFWALALSVVLHAGLVLGLRDRLAHAAPPDLAADDPGAGIWVGQPQAPSPGEPGAGDKTPIAVEVAAPEAEKGPSNDSKPETERPEGIGQRAHPVTADPAARPARPAMRASAGSGPGQGGDGDGTAGSAAALRGAVRPLLRVLPPALAADPSWGTLPVGHSDVLDLFLAVDASGKVTLDEPLADGTPEREKALVRRVLELLAWPRYAVQPSEIVEGVEHVRLRSAISEEEVSAETLASPGGAYGLGVDPPEGKRPGKAHCRWASGRRVDVVVEHLSD